MMVTCAKTLSYSLMHLSVAVIVAYVLTHDWRIALTIGLIEPMVQTIAYLLHERLWDKRLKPALVRKGVRRGRDIRETV
jgi:uncharacterized membrane protein